MSIWHKCCGRILRLMGWTVDGEAPKEKKCIILGVPHTSIWDFVISYLFYYSLGQKGHVMIKKEMFFWPLGPILRSVGCIPVDRSNAAELVRSVISEMERSDQFHLCIAPEGTRKPVRKWKMGYHTIAREVGCPVYLGYFDWGTKHVGAGSKVELTDDARADTNRIQDLYEQMQLKGKHPELYVTH
ncbi:MAG: 1-acyl-sn-glycerol-3-phosphate acyltransferase [Bacteroidales bacterium]|nr:1-acyl-sn-glycerol-3-phosphate acyltransferase [Bacteroidales bacterium]